VVGTPNATNEGIVDKALETDAAKMVLNIQPGCPIYTYDITEILGAANYLAYW
jgi:hypothetical protein